MAKDPSSLYTLPLPGLTQRWREKRSFYRPAGEVIRPSEYEVELLQNEAEARAFVATHHYARSLPVCQHIFGLYRHGSLVGVAVFSVPMNYAAYTSVFIRPAGGLAREKFESLNFSPKQCSDLGRLCLLDSVPGNAETFFVSRCFDVLRRQGIRGVISFSDPVPRTNAENVTLHPGHVGSAMQALNMQFCQRGTPRTLRLLPDATVFSDRSMQKIRALEKGWCGAARTLRRFGADEPPADAEARIAWLNHWVAQLTRPLRHTGNFKYAIALDRRLRQFMPPPRPYPKLIAAPPHDAMAA